MAAKVPYNKIINYSKHIIIDAKYSIFYKKISKIMKLCFSKNIKIFIVMHYLCTFLIIQYFQCFLKFHIHNYLFNNFLMWEFVRCYMFVIIKNTLYFGRINKIKIINTSIINNYKSNMNNKYVLFSCQH